MNGWLVVLGCSSGVLLILWLRQRTPEGENLGSLLLWLFVVGFMMTLPALLMNNAIERWTALWMGSQVVWKQTLFWMFGIGWNEEFCKLLGLVGILLFRPRLSLSQGVLCAATVAAGFSSAENVLYLQQFGADVLWVRTMLTTPAHMGFTMGSGVLIINALNTTTTQRSLAWLLGGFVLAAALHGSYDLLLSLPWRHAASIAYAQVAIMCVGMLWLPRGLLLLPQKPEK